MCTRFHEKSKLISSYMVLNTEELKNVDIKILQDKITI